MSTTAYKLDENGIWTGDTVERKPGDPVTNLAFSEPPQLEEGEFARYRRGKWEVLDEYPTPPIPVPESVPMAAAREALIDIGKLDAVEAVIDAIEDDVLRAKARAWWDHSTKVRRSSKWVAMLAPAVPLTDEEVNQLFIAADEIARNT